ncbi:MAG: hypothetical protein FWH54_03185, partial [Methanobrevibacter sp.]|nr:hypothetical protein [Methanobrevibacter sp.]
EPIADKKEHAMDKISKLESGAQNLSVVGRVMGISNPKNFKSRKFFFFFFLLCFQGNFIESRHYLANKNG